MSDNTLYITSSQLAERWGLTVQALHNWRRDEIGPKYYRFGNAVRYLKSDIQDYEARAVKGAA